MAWLERLTGAIVDTLATAVVYFLAGKIARDMSSETPNTIALYSAALFSFSPLLLRVGMGPRAYNGSPRPVGQLLYWVHLASLYVGWADENWIFLSISVLAASLIPCTAKFGTQVIIFFGVVISIIVTPMYLLVLASSAMLSVIVSKGHVLLVLDGQIQHLVFYFKYLQQRYIGLRSTLGDYLNRVNGQLLRILKLRFYEAGIWFFRERYWLNFVLLALFPLFLQCLNLKTITEVRFRLLPGVLLE